MVKPKSGSSRLLSHQTHPAWRLLLLAGMNRCKCGTSRSSSLLVAIRLWYKTFLSMWRCLIYSSLWDFLLGSSVLPFATLYAWAQYYHELATTDELAKPGPACTLTSILLSPGFVAGQGTLVNNLVNGWSFWTYTRQSKYHLRQLLCTRRRQSMRQPKHHTTEIL